MDSLVNATVTPFLIYFPRKGKVNPLISLLCFTYDGSSLFIRCEIARMSVKLQRRCRRRVRILLFRDCELKKFTADRACMMILIRRACLVLRRNANKSVCA